MSTNERCACRHLPDVGIVAVCGFHAGRVTHTPRDGYTMPCPVCSDEEGECRDVGSGSVRGRECKTCVGTGRCPVSLLAGKAAMSFVPPKVRAVDLVMSGRVGRRPRRR